MTSEDDIELIRRSADVSVVNMFAGVMSTCSNASDSLFLSLGEHSALSSFFSRRPKDETVFDSIEPNLLRPWKTLFPKLIRPGFSTTLWEELFTRAKECVGLLVDFGIWHITDSVFEEDSGQDGAGDGCGVTCCGVVTATVPRWSKDCETRAGLPQLFNFVLPGKSEG